MSPSGTSRIVALGLFVGMPSASGQPQGFMARFGIASQSPLEKWCRLYRDGGDEALRPKPKGRPGGSASRPRAPLTRERELEERVRKLEVENAYLKKLAALRAIRKSRTGIRPPL